jgi:hypothetical protein
MTDYIQCEACEKTATRRINVRYNNSNTVQHDACLKHSRIAANNLFVFLKHTRKKAKRTAG